MTKSGKYCGKRRNCMFCAISPFVTMFSKSRLLQRRPKAFIWGKGLTISSTGTEVVTIASLAIQGRPLLLSSLLVILPLDNSLCHLYTSDLHTDAFPVADLSIFIVGVGILFKETHTFITVGCFPPSNDAILPFKISDEAHDKFTSDSLLRVLLLWNLQEIMSTL